MKNINKLTLDMAKGKPSVLLLRFSMPLVLGNIFQQFYTFADTLIVGRKLGVHALAALGATEWMSFLIFGFIQGLTQGFSINVSNLARGVMSGRLPMFSMFNETVKKAARFAYSEQISILINGLEEEALRAENIVVILMNIVIAFGLFIFAYRRCGLS